MTSEESQFAAPIPGEHVTEVPAPAPAPAPTPAPAPAPVAPTKTSLKSIRVLSLLVIIAGAILIIAGAVTWFVVRDQLGDEKIVVSSDADHFAGDKVNGPLTAYSQANTIRKHALEASGGKTYAELEQDDPTRETVMTASFLRASLFTSVVSFGVAFFAAGMGVLMIIVGYVLRRLSKVIAPLVNSPAPSPTPAPAS